MRLVALMLAVLAVTNTATNAFAEIAWHTDLTAAHVEAQKSGKPMLLHFYTDNCVFCDKLEAGAFQNPDVQSAIGRGFVPVKIHAAQQPKLASLFKVNRFPTDVIVTTEGDAMSHKVSPQKPADYVQMLAACATHSATNTNNIAKTTTPAPAAAKTNTVAAKPASSKGPITAIPASTNPTAQAPAKSATAAKTEANVAQTAATLSPGAPLPNFEMPVGAPAVATASKSNAITMPVDPNKPANPSKPTVSTKAPTAEKATASTKTNATASAKAPTKSVQANADMELALDGFCAVTLLSKSQWVRGKPEFGVVHLGKLYLFNDGSARDTFLAEPIKYTPMLNGIDVVRFFEEKTIVSGKREHCVIDPDHNRIYMFADEQALEHFDQTFDRYLSTAMQIMDQAVKDANPR
jgi:thiol-disulfide isomerase/thioredoxin